MSASTHPHLTSPPLTSQSRDSINDIYGPRTPFHASPWPIRVDSTTSSTPSSWVQSACVLCSNGCGMDIGVKDNRIVGVRGRAQDRVNRGRLGPKGLHGCWAAVHSPDRLTRPMIRKGGELMAVEWDEAMQVIVEKVQDVTRRLTTHGIGIYTTGQLFLEEYHALAMVGKAGLRSLHMDGNTRLCTATAAAAMRESFGSDGQPSSYTDIDYTDCLFLVGHNMAATQTVLWARVLDRLQGPSPPTVIVVDPRLTTTAESATIHLAPRAGTNVCLLNGIQRLLIHQGTVHRAFVDEHTVGYDDLVKVVDKYTPEFVEEVTGVPAVQLVQVAHVLGSTPTLLSTVLQGVYQSNQATAAACQINNIQLLLSQIGRPGAGVLQMNGQPTAQNNRECGCNGEYPGFRNPMNQSHMQDWAKHWNLDVNTLPHWAEAPTHIMEMLSYIEHGSMQFFWVIGTNPLVSLPDLERVRRVLTQPSVFVVVQDIFMTETAQIADVVLPAAMWGEKTGSFTNVDRTVHISLKAVDPPGEAKSDLAIFVDFARRMGWKDKDGGPLLPFETAKEAFDAWKRSTEGRPCDYTGLSYEKLTGGSGVQWPCNAVSSPDGTERLFTDYRFYTDIDYCESYGHDLETGTPYTEAEYRAMNPAGRAFLKSCHYRPGEEQPSAEYPLRLTTGRNVYHFHTRTKTGRDQHLAAAAGDANVLVAPVDADKVGVNDGDWAIVRSPRGQVEVRVKVNESIAAGNVFIPFHFGYWDAVDDRPRAANELTLTAWDNVSKQPLLKAGCVRIERVDGVQIHSHRRGGQDVHPPVRPGEVKQLQSAAIDRARKKGETTTSEVGKHRYVEDALLKVWVGTRVLMDLYQQLSEDHRKDTEIRQGLLIMQSLACKVRDLMQPLVERYVGGERGERERRIEERERAVVKSLFPEGRLTGEVSVGYALLRDLQALWMLCQGLGTGLTALTPTAAALHDEQLMKAVAECSHEAHRQGAWVQSKVKVKSAQALIVPALPGR